MWDLFRLIFGLIIDLFRSRAALEAEVLVLKQQIIVLRRGRPNRMPFLAVDRVVLGWVCHLFPKARGAAHLAANAPQFLFEFFHIFEFALDDTGEVVRRNILSYHHADRASAVAFIEKEISKYPSHAYDEEQKHWWGRDAGGEIHRFAIVTPDEPLDPVAPLTPGSKR